MTLRLFYSPGACSLVPHIALEEAGADFEPVRVAIAEGAHRRPEYLAINPRGLIPALDNDGQIVTENVAILAFLGHRFPASGLLPLDDLPALARVFELLAFFACAVHQGGFRPLFVARRSETRWSRSDEDRLLAHFREIDGLLTGGGWLLGDRFSLADGYPLTFWRWGRRLGFDMAAYEHWTDHARRMVERPAVLRAVEREGLKAEEFEPA